MNNLKIYKRNIKKTIGLITLSVITAASSICIAGCETLVDNTYQELEEQQEIEYGKPLVYVFEKQIRTDLDSDWESSGVLITTKMPTQLDNEKYEYIDMILDDEDNLKER